MLEGPKGAELARLEDCLSEDTLVRAIMFGWDSIGESCELSPFWRIIRQLDENFFRLFGPIERMASFKIMHTLLKFHSDPTVQRAATLPNFYQSRLGLWLWIRGRVLISIGVLILKEITILAISCHGENDFDPPHDYG